MRCEKAHEFFSDYIDGTLERPMTVAVESHLQACRVCTADVVSLRAAWAALDALPAVEPPTDFARRVAGAVLADREQRRQREGWRIPLPQQWLRGFTPVHAVGLAACAALLAVGLAFPLRPETTHVKWDLFGLSRQAPRPVSNVQVSLGEARWEDGQWMGTVIVTPTVDLPEGTVAAAPQSLAGDHLDGPEPVNVAEGNMSAGRSYTVPVALGPAVSGAAVVLLRISSPSLPAVIDQRLYFPIPEPGAVAGPFTLETRETDVHLLLAQWAGLSHRPVVADAGLVGRVALRLYHASPEEALNRIVEPLGYRSQSIGRGYSITGP